MCALALGCGRTKPEDPLLLAIMDSDAEAVRALLDGGVDPNEILAKGQTPLQLAVYVGNLEVLGLFLERGADPNPPGGGTSPLHFAVISNRLAVGKLLLEYGADVNATASDGATPLAYALQRSGKKEFVELLKAHGATTGWGSRALTRLLQAVATGDAEGVGSLLDEGIDPNGPGGRGAPLR
ncbi:MAG: ankyrin repeat domain-containing protein, partial [Planctomycetota bacterium]